MKRRILPLTAAIALLLPGTPQALHCQQYTGTTGLLHTPSAEMNPEGTALAGTHIFDRHNLPGNWKLYRGDTYNTFNYYLGIAMYDWVELAYTCTEKKTSGDGYWGGYGGKDRYFSVKFRPLKESGFLPSVAIGMNDIYTGVGSEDVESGDQYFYGNAYVAFTRHFHPAGGEIAVTASYRRFFQELNSKWNGVVGGVTWRPSFFPQMRLIAEYSGAGANVGADALLWDFLLLQVSAYECRYVNVGLCFRIDLTHNNK